MRLFHSILCVLLMSPTHRRLSSWFEDHKKKILILWFTGFKSNLLLSRVFLFHRAACNVFHLFGPSARLMLLGWEMSSLWVTVTVTELCMSLLIITLTRCCMYATTFGPLGVHYGRRPECEFDSMLQNNSDLAHLAGKMFFVWEGNHQLTVWWRHINKHHSLDKDWHISVDCIVVDPRNCTTVFLNAMNDINSLPRKMAKRNFDLLCA